jgi:DNA-binding XRE family transcriptional regulator
MDLNISREALSHYENGKRSPDIQMLRKLSWYFGVSIDFLINGEEFDDYKFTVTSDTVLTPVYVDTIYRQYCEGWNYNSYVIVNGGEMHYSTEFEGKAGTTFELNTTYDPNDGCTVFLGWYMETYGLNGPEYILISDKQEFTYTITGEETGFLYAVWTTGENPFIKKYVDIRATNGFVSYVGGEASENFDNAYSVISLSSMGRVAFFDDPTDETIYTNWDIAYRYELEGEIQHEIAESYEDEYGYYPAEYWVNDPQYNYPDGEINVTGIDASSEDFEGEI